MTHAQLGALLARLSTEVKDEEIQFMIRQAYRAHMRHNMELAISLLRELADRIGGTRAKTIRDASGAYYGR